MKPPVLVLMTAVTTVLSTMPVYAQDKALDMPIDRMVVSRSGGQPTPTALDPVVPAQIDEAFTQNVVTAGERIFDPDNFMLKLVTVQPVGETGFSAWQLGSDEGGMGHAQSAPNPLAYFSAGIAANLYTSLMQASDVMGLSVDDMKVEAKVDFRWQGPFTPQWAGFTDAVTVNIVIDSDEPLEELRALQELALRGWIAGEGLANATEVDAALAVNGTHWDDMGGKPGLIPDPVSVDSGFTLSQKTGTPQLETIDPGEDFGMDGPMGTQMPPSIAFSVVGVVTSAHNADRPYLHRINVRAMQDNYSGWALYADDSTGVDGLERAPSSLDYLTAGTTLCLMSQMGITPMALGLDIADYRAEHQFSYRQDGFMTAEMAGFTDDIQTRIVVNSTESAERLEDYFNLSLRLCFAGEAWTGETTITSDLFVNGALVR